MAFNKHKDSDIEFREQSEYQGEQKYSIKEIILRHIRKISDLCCQEFTGGYWEKKPIKTATGIMFMETYHQDVREAYCNSVDFLVDVIYPFADKDTELKKYLDENEKIDIEQDDIKTKLKHKKKTFRQINMMFERINFWQGMESYNE